MLFSNLSPVKKNWFTPLYFFFGILLNRPFKNQILKKKLVFEWPISGYSTKKNQRDQT